MWYPDGIARHTPVLTGDIVLKVISLDSAMSPHVGDALANLTNGYTWHLDHDPIEDVTDAARITLEDYYQNMLVGSVCSWLINPPDGWLLLDGTTYAQADYPELSALLPTHLKSTPNFTLPDVTAAFAYGVADEDDGSALAGSNTLNMSIAQMPAHTHTYIPPVLTVEAETPAVPIPTAGVGAAIATGSTGSGDDIDKRPLRFGLVYAVFAGRT